MSISKTEHENILSELKKRYKKEALHACEKRYKAGFKEGAATVPSVASSSRPAKNPAHEEAALVSKITSKLKKKYKIEALKACEAKYEEGRQSMKVELHDMFSNKKKEFKQAVIDARSEAEREARRRKQLQGTTDRALAAKDDAIDRLEVELRKVRVDGNTTAPGGSTTKMNNSDDHIRTVLDSAYTKAKRIMSSGSADDLNRNSMSVIL